MNPDLRTGLQYALVAAVLVRLVFSIRSYRRTSRWVSELRGAIHQAKQLRQRDPAAADRLIGAQFQKHLTAREADRNLLRQRVGSDVHAAKVLRTRLLEDQAVDEAARRDFKKLSGADPSCNEALQVIDKGMKERREELTRLDALIGQHDH